MLISIGLPAYKSQYLAFSIQSILNQTYSNFELIVINDDSPDPIEEIIKGFDDPRIHFYSNERNLGKDNLAVCWNLTLEKASGKYFVLASDDDFYEAAFLEKMVSKTLQYPSVDVFHCRLRLVDITGQTIDITETCSEHEDILDYMWHRIIKNRNQMATEFMYKTERLINEGGFCSMPVGWGSDDLTSFKLAKENGIVFVNEILCNWRQSGDNISTSHEFYYQKMLAINKYRLWVNEFITTLEKDNSTSYYFLELKEKTNKQLDIKLNETGALLVYYSGIINIPRNVRICRKEFNIKRISILGSLVESFGKKFKNKTHFISWFILFLLHGH